MNELTTTERTLRPRSSASPLLVALAAAVIVAVGLLFLVPLQKAVAQVNQEQPPDFLLQWGSAGTGEGQFDVPADVAVDSSGNVYVADRDNHRIQKFTADGEFLLQWGSQGTGEGQLFFPRGVAVDSSDNVYVADPGNERIQKFTADGEFLLQWGSAGSGEGQFDNPAGVGVDSSGNVYVTDFNNHRIQKFTADGEFLAQWGSAGSDEGQFSFPVGVAVDSSDNVYVADPGNSRIQKFGIATADTTPPILKLPEEGITVNATGADGALVTFEVSATDDTDPNPVVNCSPASRSTFPIGTTTVTCTATDSSGKTASGTFPVTVIGATGQISDIKVLVTSLALPAGIDTSLQAKLNDAFSAANGGDTASACTALKDFISQVRAQQGKKKISAQDAEELIVEAQRIQAVLGC
jgi:sugar lactone lactonase YvrE